MLLLQREYTLCSLLEQAFTRQALQCVFRRRHYSSQATLSRSKDVAIIGGGITGLVSAYRLAKLSPQSRVTIYEAGGRLGGWIDSRYVDGDKGKKILFERGPRTLRPVGVNAEVTLQLVHDLGLDDEIITTSKDAASALNRYIFDGHQLVRMPHPRDGLVSIMSDCLSKPLLSGVMLGILLEWVRPRRPREMADESIGSFISRRFNSQVADNLASALFHGIYAGDIYSLSAASILPSLWFSEGRFGSLTAGMFAKLGEIEDYSQARDLLLLEQLSKSSADRINTSNASVFSFRRGMQTLPQTLEERLRKLPNVQIQCNTAVKTLELHPGGIKVTCEDEKKSSFHTLALATVSSRLLSRLISMNSSKDEISSIGDGLAKILATGPTVTVGLVNLYFPPTPEPLHPPGFGYLLPRTTSFLSNPERALGVIFDSDTISGQDIYPDDHVPRGTKMTVMLGGHWWNDFDQLPTEHELSRMALSVLRRHLHIHIDPTIIQASIQKECIPQYPVGHNQTMMQLRTVLRQVHGGRIRVAGSSYTGVGVNDCVRAGWDAAEGIAGNSRTHDRELYTGLEMFEQGEEYQWTAVRKS